MPNLQLLNPQLLDVEKVLTLETPQYIIEDATVQHLDSGLRKKFTSLSKSPVTYTKIYDPTKFRWKFGDEEDPTQYTETTSRAIYHIYKKPGTYLVQHQACNFCTCSDWGICYQEIAVELPPPIPPWLLAGGFLAFIFFARERCNKIDNKLTCEKQCCRWVDKPKKWCFRPGKEECLKVMQKEECEWREKGRLCHIKPRPELRPKTKKSK